MKRIFIFLVALAAWSCGNTGSNSSDVNAEASVENSSEDPNAAGEFGAPLGAGDAVDLVALQRSLDETNSFEGKVKVEIDDVCQMKGCWMTAKLPDGRSMRITFKDYGFFVPKNSAGYTAVIEGLAEKKITDEETLRHYAQESGKSAEEIEAIDGPGEELSFVATGVVIEEL